MIPPNNLLKRHVFNFNPQDNGGESLLLTTDFLKNEDGFIYVTQELQLCSYCNSAAFYLAGTMLTADLLRELANQLDRAEIEARNILDRKNNGTN